MIFTLEHNNIINCRLMCEDIDGALVQFNEVPYSKFFGFISEHIFETLRVIEKTNCFFDDTMEQLFKRFPIKFSIVYKNNTEFNQGISRDISDFSYTKGGGYGSKPSNISRVYNKQIVVAFHFINNPPWINEFALVWKNRGIDLKGTMLTKKNIVNSIDKISFSYDDSISYYTYVGFVKSENTILNPSKMLFMFNSKNPKDSLYIEGLERQIIDSFSCEDVFKETPFIDVGC